MKIYAGNLANTIDDQMLQELFSPYGEVTSARVIKDRFTGDSRGFGFVEMAEKEMAIAAIEGLNGSEVEGQTLRMSEAREREDRPRGGYGR